MLNKNTALVFYEHLVTLSDEIDVFWIDFKLNSVSFLFISTRLVLLANAAVNVSGQFSVSL